LLPPHVLGWAFVWVAGFDYFATLLHTGKFQTHRFLVLVFALVFVVGVSPSNRFIASSLACSSFFIANRSFIFRSPLVCYARHNKVGFTGFIAVLGWFA
jgi:hypothetical protein